MEHRKLLGQSQSYLLSKLHIKMLSTAGPNGDSIATPSTCLYLLLNMKKVSLVAMLRKLQKSCFGMLGGFLLSLCKLSTQILMVFSKGILVTKESTSRLARNSFHV